MTSTAAARPIILPTPLDNLVAGLAAGRRRPGSSLLEVPSPWPFPAATREQR